MNNISVGTILHESFCCSGITNTFYVVDSISKSGKTCTIRKIGSKCTECERDGQNGFEIPDTNIDNGVVTSRKYKLIDGTFHEEVKPIKFKIYSDHIMHRSIYMSVWNNKPCRYMCA